MRLPLTLCLALAACAPSAAQVGTETERAARADAALDRALAGLTPEAPQTCISGIDRRFTRQTRIVGDTLLFRISRNQIVRNDMGAGCNLRGDPILVTQTPTTRLCRGDIVQLIDRASRFPIGACSYGDFVTYRRAGR